MGDSVLGINSILLSQLPHFKMESNHMYSQVDKDASRRKVIMWVVGVVAVLLVGLIIYFAVSLFSEGPEDEGEGEDLSGVNGDIPNFDAPSSADIGPSGDESEPGNGDTGPITEDTSVEGEIVEGEGPDLNFDAPSTADLGPEDPAVDEDPEPNLDFDAPSTADPGPGGL